MKERDDDGDIIIRGRRRRRRRREGMKSLKLALKIYILKIATIITMKHRL